MEAAPARQSPSPLAHIPSASSVSWLAWRFPRGLAWRALAALTGGLILRLWMLSAFPQNQGDSLIYGNIAKNILLHHQFALTDGSGVIHPTLIRLPGYPIFLAACFRLLGVDNYRAVAWLQIALELAACLLLADFVRRIRSPRAGLNTLWLAALCPFNAVYASAPLTESLTFDMICLALWSLERHLTPPPDDAGAPGLASRLAPEPAFGTLVPTLHLAAFTLAITAAALLRPDGAILAFALWPALILSRRFGQSFQSALQKAILVGVIALIPFAAWGVRNWHAFHLFEPLAPRYANDPGEDPHLGWQHWVKTWCIDFTCTEEVYWNVPDSPLDFNALPGRAFDSSAERDETAALVAAYNDNQELTPAIDRHFGSLARQRAAAHPLRSHLILPLARLADMTLRPRVENLTIDLRWWQYSLHRSETRFSWAYASVNLLFLLLGIWGLALRPRFWPYMCSYLVLRSLLLMTIEAPETRYTLEFFPILFAGAAIALERLFSRKPSPHDLTRAGKAKLVT